LEVLALLRQGLTNHQIADRLGISESGARYHVSEILSKLGVGSREEAARWQPGRPALGIGVLAGLRNSAAGAARSAAFVPIVLVVALLAALALGLVVMSSRSGGSSADGTVAIVGGEEASVRMLRDLAAEATQDARSVLPGAELVFVAYATPSGFYTFRFSQPGSRAEVSILGPHEGIPGVSRWERIEEDLPIERPAFKPLDLASIQHSFAAVAEAAALESRSADTPQNMGVLIFNNDDGALTWNTTARLSQDILVRCETPDADLSLMTCVP
jgi:hypothetical protein